MEDKLEKYLEEILQLIKSGIEFTAEQIPIFVQELLTYYIWFHSSFVFMTLLVCAILVFVSIRIYKNASPSDKDVAEVVAWIINIPTFLGLILAVHHILQIIKVIVAPRLYLIEAIQSLM